MTHSSKASRFVLAIGLLVLLTVSPTLAKDKKTVIETFTAFATNLGVGAATQININLFEFTSEEERKQLIDTFVAGGGAALYKALDDMTMAEEKAYMRIGGSQGYQLFYAYEAMVEGKRQVVFVTARPITMGESLSNSRSLDNNLTLVAIQLDPETGEGTGAMSLATELTIDKKTGKLDIETVGNQTTKFNKVTSKKPKQKKQK